MTESLTDTIADTVAHAMQVAAPVHKVVAHAVPAVPKGFSGTFLPYLPQTDDLIAGILLVCFFISAFVLAHSRKFLFQQAKDFISYHKRGSIFDTSTVTDVRYLLLLVIQTCIFSGIVLFILFITLQPELTRKLEPPSLLGMYIGVCLLYLVIKWLLYTFLGWIFFDRNKVSEWLEAYSAIIYYLGFALFPFVLYLVYFDYDLTYIVSISLFLFVFVKILMFCKWCKLFFRNIIDVFLIILYFCALEIMPLILLYKGMIELNNLLAIKF